MGPRPTTRGERGGRVAQDISGGTLDQRQAMFEVARWLAGCCAEHFSRAEMPVDARVATFTEANVLWREQLGRLVDWMAEHPRSPFGSDQLRMVALAGAAAARMNAIGGRDHHARA